MSKYTDHLRSATNLIFEFKDKPGFKELAQLQLKTILKLFQILIKQKQYKRYSSNSILAEIVGYIRDNYDKPINIGSDRLISVDGLTDLIIKISGKKLTKTYDLSAPEGVKGRNADLTLVKNLLGWEPQIDLEIGLYRTYRWISAMVEKDINTER